VRTHVVHLARSRARNLGVAGVIIGALLVAFASPASAHTVEVSGTTSCPDENHLVTWTIHNPETLSDRTMTIVSTTAEVDGQTYPVDVDASSIPPQGSAQGTTVVPGDVSGTITITVRVRFPDDFRAHAEGSVELTPPCLETTTTTSAPPTTATTSPPTTDTSGPPNTGGTSPSSGGPGPSSGGPQGPVGPNQSVEGGVAGIEAGAGGGTLPTTGAPTTNWAAVGAIAIAFGGMLLVVSRRSLFARR
jgi:LPXTG-motif cell wall-anchored protein